MTYKYSLKRAALFVLCFAVVMSFSLLIPVQQANAAKKMKLPDKAVAYEKIDGKWEKSFVTTLKYNKKGQLTKVKVNKCDSTQKYTMKLKYKKTSKKTTVTANPSGDEYSIYKFTIDKKGRLTKVSCKYEDGIETIKYSYDKKGFLTKAKIKDTNTEYSIHSGTSRYTTSYYRGKKVSQITRKQIILGSSYPDELYYSITTATFLKNGLKSSEADNKYTYKKSKKGYVKEKYITYNDGEYQSDYKVVYTYGKKKATKAKIYKMINHDERVMLTHMVPTYAF